VTLPALPTYHQNQKAKARPPLANLPKQSSMDYTTPPTWAAFAGLALLAIISYVGAVRRRRSGRRYPPVVGTVFHKLYHFRRLHDYLTDLSRRRKTFRLLARPSTLAAVKQNTYPAQKLSHRLFHQSPAFNMVKELKTKAEYEEALKSAEEKLVVLDCFATWCGPCRAIAPKIVKFSEEYADVEFYKLDVDTVPDVAAELGIKAMPTFLFFKKGEKIHEVVGANPGAIKAAIDSKKVA